MASAVLFTRARGLLAGAWRLQGVALVAALALAACGDGDQKAADGEEGVEDLTIMVESDKSRILEQEQSLKEKRETVEQERERLTRERSELEQKLATLSKKDKKQRVQLESEQDRLRDEEKRIRERTRAFEAERAKLETEKTRLLERLSQAGQSKGGLTVEQREEVMARREKDVARREAKLVEREKEVARLQADSVAALQEIQRILAALQEGGGMTRTVVVNAAPAAPSGSGATKAQVLKVQRQVRAVMDAKGILAGDLPPAARELEDAGKGAISSKDFDAASEAFAKLQDIVNGIKVDYAFVQGKFARVARLYDAKKGGLEESRRKRVDALLADVSESVTDGRYDRANKKINQLHSLLQEGGG